MNSKELDNLHGLTNGTISILFGKFAGELKSSAYETFDTIKSAAESVPTNKTLIRE